MASKILVSVAGVTGLDGVDELRDELARATGVVWSVAEVEGEPEGHLGLHDILLEALVSTGLEMTLHAAFDGAKKTVEDWRATRLEKSWTKDEVIVLDVRLVLGADPDPHADSDSDAGTDTDTDTDADSDDDPGPAASPNADGA